MFPNLRSLCAHNNLDRFSIRARFGRRDAISILKLEWMTWLAPAFRARKPAARCRSKVGCTEVHQERVRETRRVNWFDDFVQDLRYGRAW